MRVETSVSGQLVIRIFMPTKVLHKFDRKITSQPCANGRAGFPIDDLAGSPKPIVLRANGASVSWRSPQGVSRRENAVVHLLLTTNQVLTTSLLATNAKRLRKGALATKQSSFDAFASLATTLMGQTVCQTSRHTRSLNF
jgi:hypothetical protein